jgi:hypothetical protein
MTDEKKIPDEKLKEVEGGALPQDFEPTSDVKEDISTDGPNPKLKRPKPPWADKV